VSRTFLSSSKRRLLLTFFPSQNEDVVGSISAIIWSLTLVPLIKYVSRATRSEIFPGRADLVLSSLSSPCISGREREKEVSETIIVLDSTRRPDLSFLFSLHLGTFALWTALFPRKAPSDEDRQLTRYLTEEAVVEEKVAASHRTGFNLLHKSKWPLMVWALFGTSLVLGDGCVAFSLLFPCSPLLTALLPLSQSVDSRCLGRLVGLVLSPLRDLVLGSDSSFSHTALWEVSLSLNPQSSTRSSPSASPSSSFSS
jgi:hypothetical protein